MDALKVFVILFMLNIFSLNGFAQATVNGTSTFEGGLGFYSSDMYNSGNPWITTPHAFSIAYDQEASKKISVGFYFGQITDKYSVIGYAPQAVSWTGPPSAILTFTQAVDLFYLRCSFHCFTSNKLDTYFGVMFGLQTYNLTGSSSNPYYFSADTFYEEPNKLGAGIYLGVKYYFIKHFGVYTEISYGGIGVVNVGLLVSF